MASARQDHVTGPAFLLVAGRTVGMVATFAIGPLFARLFSVEDVGTFLQFFLLYGVLFGLAQIGMAESLYYFLPRAQGAVGRYVCNSAITLLAAGLATTAGLWFARYDIAAYFNNPALVGYLLPLGAYLTLMLVGAVLEIMMVSRKQHMRAAVAYALSDLVRTMLFVVPALYFVSLRAVFIGAVIFAAIRLAMMLVVVWRQFGRDFRPDLALWRTQFAYALPFALAVGVEVIIIRYHEFVVGGAFDPQTFAIYGRGVMTIPALDLIITSTTSVMMVQMAERAHDKGEALGLFHDTVSRLAFLLVPLAIGLAVLAQPFIIALYTPAFAGSVPVFAVWSLAMLPMVFAVDAVLRAYAQTRYLLLMNLVRLACVAALIGWFLDAFSLVGAVLATVTALVAAKSLGVVRVAQLMEVSVAQVLPWPAIGRIALRAVAAAVPTWLVAARFADTPWIALAAGGAVYGLVYAVLSYAPGVAEPAAIRLPIVARLRRLPVVGRAFMSRPLSNAPLASSQGEL